jgi:YidC/Oxa1 family membrane protein insertase
MEQQRNLFIAIALSIAILLGFQFLIQPHTQKPPAPPVTTQSAPKTGPATAEAPGTAGAPTATPPATREGAVAASPRIRIETPALNGSISLRGARIDDLSLAQFRETVDPNSPEIVLLSPSGSPNPYLAEFGWVASGGGVKLPDADTEWSAAPGQVLTPSKPIVLTWDNGAGLKFTRTIAVDDRYMFTVKERVENTGGEPVKLMPYGLLSRTGTPHTSGYWILHEGLVGVLEGTTKEITYKAMQGEKPVVEASTGGWVGITDKYWLTALIPDQKEAIKARFTHSLEDHVDRYQTDFLGAEREVPPGGSVEETSRLFGGAKVVKQLEHYRDELGIQRFDYAVDWGWFYFLTKPIFHILNFFHGLLGNFGLSILLLTVIIKLIFFPLANKSYAAMSKMKALQPKMTELREKYGDDKARLNQEMMALYKQHGANPVAGCLPIVIQIPVFFSLYKVLFVTIEMRHAPFFGWIHDLSAPDPTSLFNLFGLIPWHPPAMLMIGAWPLIMGVTMFLQQKLNPQPADPIQARMFMFLPIVFTYMLASFPAGLVIYWAWNNTLSVLQQWVIMRRAGVK